MLQRVLMVAYHFPPVLESSGLQRTLNFCRHLPEFGWRPSVLTAHPRAYGRTDSAQLSEIPDGMTVCRAAALDTARHLAVHGRYPAWLALPDRWVSWWPAGVAAGLALIRRERPALLWSTYPIATAHLIGLTLHRLTGIPWVADCRDSLVDHGYPPPGPQRRVQQWLERQLVAHSRRVVFTTTGTRRLYLERYPDIPAGRWAVIANGYAEDNFIRAEQQTSESSDRGGKAGLTLVHSGLLYPSERDPRPFFAALAELERDPLFAGKFNVVLRASGHEAYHRQEIERVGVQDRVTLAPPLPYEAALREMLDADGLLLFQAANCNHQIPAKVYEYLRARRPILALTAAAGDTAALLRHAGIDTIVPLDNAAAIAAGLRDFLIRLRAGTAPVAGPAEITRHSRQAHTRELAELFDGLIRKNTVLP